MTEAAKGNGYTPPDLCRHAWYDGHQSHVCRLPKDHPPPCKCSGSGCTAVDQLTAQSDAR